MFFTLFEPYIAYFHSIHRFEIAMLIPPQKAFQKQPCIKGIPVHLNVKVNQIGKVKVYTQFEYNIITHFLKLPWIA